MEVGCKTLLLVNERVVNLVSLVSYVVENEVFLKESKLVANEKN